MDRVTVIGAWRMGSALATALHKRGFETTVWNRTPSKMEFLSRLGSRVAMQLVKTLMPAMEAALSDLNSKVQSKDYSNTQATLATWTVAPRELAGWCAKHRVTDTFAPLCFHSCSAPSRVATAITISLICTRF